MKYRVDYITKAEVNKLWNTVHFLVKDDSMKSIGRVVYGEVENVAWHSIHVSDMEMINTIIDEFVYAT